METVTSKHTETECFRDVLILRRKDHKPASSGLFPEESRVVVVEGFDAALEELQHAHYDLIVIEDVGLLASQRGTIAHQSSVILETISQGVGIFDLSGNLLWGNHRFEELPQDVLEKLKTRCLALFAETISEGYAERAGRRLSIKGVDGSCFEATASAIMDDQERISQIAVVIWDATSSRQLRQKLDAIDWAGRELVHLESSRVEKLDIPGRLSLLEEKIIHCTREVLGFDKFCIRLLDKKANRLEIILSSGLSDRAKNIDIYASTENNGISGYVAATGRSYICPNVSQDRRYLYGIDNAGSSLTVPLFLQDKVVGVFNIESERAGAFTEDDRQFAEIFGRYVAIAMNILDLLVVERSHATGQIADNVTAEISGPLNDILTEATSLMEEYIGRDDLRGKLESICDNVAAVRRVLKQLASGPTGLIDHSRTLPTKDAVISDKSILVVDDEPIIRETITDILTGAGADVAGARDGNEAIAMATARKYDLILSDIKMPQKSGYDIFAAAKDANPEVPIVFMTGFGYDPNHSIIRARQEGLAGVLYKPFKVSEFLTLIKDVLREAKVQAS